MKLGSAPLVAAALSCGGRIAASANDNVPSTGMHYGAGKNGQPSTSGPLAEEGR